MSKLNKVLSAMNTSKIRRLDIRVNRDDQYITRVYFNGQMFHIDHQTKECKEIKKDRSELFEQIETKDVLFIEVEWRDGMKYTLPGGELLSESLDSISR